MDKGKHLKWVCSECWRSISEFSEFQASVLLAQTKLSDVDSEALVKEEEPLEFFDILEPSTSILLNEPKEEFIALSDSEKHDATASGPSATDLLRIEPGDSAASKTYERPTRTRSSRRLRGESTSDASEVEFLPQPGDQNWSELELSQSESDDVYSSDFEYPRQKKSHGINQWTRDSTEPFNPEEYLRGDDTVLSSEMELTESEPEEERRDADDNTKKQPTDKKSSVEERLERQRKQEFLDQLVAKFMPNIQCIACPETYTNLKELQAHFRQQHPKEKFYVQCCNLKLPVPTRFREHLIIHSNPDAFKCQLCGRTYSLKSGLIGHMALRHPEAVEPKIYSCKKCCKSYDSARRLSFHVKVTHAERIPQKRQRLRRRQRKAANTPDGPGAFTCTECGKQFDKSRSFNQHQWYSHRLEPKHTCITCGKSFKLKYDLRKHVAIHTGYSCAFCPLTFTNIAELHTHRNTNHLDKTGSAAKN